MKNTKSKRRTVKYVFIVIVFCICNYSVVQAQNQLYPENFDLTTLNGSNGFTVPGLPNHKQFGAETQFIGDINNDGLEDIALITGTGTINGLEFAGAAYIIYGSTSPFPTPFDVTSLDGTNGFAVEGIAEHERRGRSITGPGDINGDGIDDLIIGASSGDMIVLYGSTTLPALITINYVTDGTKGFIIDAPSSTMVASLGDVNGDNINDFITGVRPNKSWVIFGRSTNYPSSIDINWLDGTKGFRTDGFEGTIPAYKVGGAGDINNDGFNDILIGNWDSTDPAVSYILFGKGTAFSSLVDLEALDGTDGFSIDNNGGGFLSFVGTLGDINDDGIDDFFSETNAIYGSTDPFPAHFPQSSLNGTDGFVLPGTLTSAPIGDINNDGIDDFISVYGSGGVAYIVFGSTSGFPNPINDSALDGTNGFVINNLDTSNIGRPVSGGGDINGDGITDFVLSSPYPSASVGTGDAYVIFGGDHYAMPLTAGYPKVVNVTSTQLTLVVNGPETGTIHYAIYPGSNYGAKDYDDILNGNDGAIAYASFSMNIQNSDINEIVSSIPENSSFDIYQFLEDAAGNRSQVYENLNVMASTLSNEDYLLSGLEIYPNPVLTELNITVSEIATYKLSSQNGQILLAGKLKNGNNSINISNLSQGLYFLSIKTDTGIVTKKIMKN